MKFNPGDRVRCINESGAPGDLKRGGIYTVAESYDAVEEWGIKLKEFPSLGFFESRFELVKDDQFSLDQIDY